jgi:hypothetical protein
MPATASEFRAWAEAVRKWARQTTDAEIADRMLQLATELEEIAQLREKAARRLSVTQQLDR